MSGREKRLIFKQFLVLSSRAMEKRNRLKHDGMNVLAQRVEFNITRNLGMLLKLENQHEIFHIHGQIFQRNLNIAVQRQRSLE